MKTLTAKRPPYVVVSGRQAFSKQTRKLSVVAKLVYILMLIGLRQSKIYCGVFTSIYPQTIRRICRSLTTDDIAAAIGDIKQAGLIEYDDETGDLYVPDWWINNMIGQNPSHLVKFQKALDLLDMSDHYRGLAQDDLEKVKDRYDNRRKNDNGQYKAISDLVYAAKIQPDFIWSIDFARMSVYEQLTYLTLYIGAVRDAKVTGCYTNMDEFAIADILGGDVDTDKIRDALEFLDQSGFIKFDYFTYDLIVPDFLEQNVWATSFTTYKMWLDLFGEVQIKNPEMQQMINDALSKAEAEMFDNYDGIANRLSTVGYTEEYDGKKITYKRDKDGVLTRTVEIKAKEKANEKADPPVDKKAEETKETRPKIIKFKNDDCMADLMGDEAESEDIADMEADYKYSQAAVDQMNAEILAKSLGY